MAKQVLSVLMVMLLAGALVYGCEFGATSSPNDGDTPDGDADGDTPDGDTPDGDTPDGDTIETYTLNAPASWVTEPETKSVVNIRQSWLKDTAHTIAISWRTEYAGEEYMPRVWFAKATDVDMNADPVMIPYSEANIAEGTPFYYEASHDGEKVTMVLWTVEITGLAPYTDYVFRAGTWGEVDLENLTMSSPNLSEVHKFRTGREAGSKEHFTFMSAGDSRGAYDMISNNADRLAAMDPDFWLFNGDMTTGGSQDEWLSWFNAMDPIMNNTAMLTVQGNHEILADLYYYQFALPIMGDKLPDEWKEHAWSFDYGNAHFIGLNTITELVVEEQKAWLEADLIAANANENIDWIIVMFHHPAYSASKKHGSTDRVITHFVPLFEKYNVDLGFSGHDHNYERTCSVLAGNCKDDNSGVTYVVVGGFYSDGYSNGEDWWTVKSFHGDLYNYMMVDINGTTLNATAYDGEGNELDTFTLTK